MGNLEEADRAEGKRALTGNGQNQQKKPRKGGTVLKDSKSEKDAASVVPEIPVCGAAINTNLWGAEALF